MTLVIAGPGAGALNPFLLWALIPYLSVAIVAYRYRTRRLCTICLLLASVLISILGPYAYFDLFHAHLDPQSAVGLVFVPLWQFALFGVLLLGSLAVNALVIRFWGEEGNTPEPPKP